MRDQITQMGTQSMCALYKPDSSPLQEESRQDGPQNQPSPGGMEEKSCSHTGSEPEGENDVPSPRHLKGQSLDQHCLRVRDRGKSVQRRWRQKLKVGLN